MKMDIQRVKAAFARLERNERVLAWLDEYGTQLTGTDNSQFEFEGKPGYAADCLGAYEAAELIAAHAARMLPELVRISTENCRNAVAADKAVIQEELAK